MAEMSERPEVWPAEGKQFYAHLLAQERYTGPIVDPRERGLCVQWIVRACSDYGFRGGVAGLACKLFDAFLSNARTQKGCSARELTFKQLMVKAAGHLLDMSVHKESALCELLCIVCISISAKKVEPKERAPHLGDFDENFTLDELKQAEALVLNTLRWRISYATPYDAVHYWVMRLHRNMDRAKFIMLCEEAIGKSIPEHSISDRRATVFGGAVTIWALVVMGIDTTEWEAELETHLKFAMEDTLVTSEDIGVHLRDEYPMGYKPRRVDSPANIMDLRMHFSDSPVSHQGLKRPVPERPAGVDKKPKAN